MGRGFRRKAYVDPFVSKLGQTTVDEMNGMGEEALRKVIVEATASISKAKVELEANEKYKELKSSMKHVTGGFRDLKKRQTTRVTYALKRMSEIGKDPVTVEVLEK